MQGFSKLIVVMVSLVSLTTLAQSIQPKAPQLPTSLLGLFSTEWQRRDPGAWQEYLASAEQAILSNQSQLLYKNTLAKKEASFLGTLYGKFESTAPARREDPFLQQYYGPYAGIPTTTGTTSTSNNLSDSLESIVHISRVIAKIQSLWLQTLNDPSQPLSEEAQTSLRQKIALLKSLDSELANNFRAQHSDIQKRLSQILKATRDLSKRFEVNGSTEQKQLAYALADTLYGSLSLSERIEALSSAQPPFNAMTTRDREEAISILQQQEALALSLGEESATLDTAAKIKKLLEQYAEVPSEFNYELATAITALQNFAESAGSLMTGDIAGFASSYSKSIIALVDRDGELDIEQFRHSQIMSTLDVLVQGQQLILETLGEMMELISHQFLEVHQSLNQIRRITRATQKVIFDASFEGLRDCRQFFETQNYYGASRFGFESYQDLLNHHASLPGIYGGCRRFINDQLRGDALTAMKIIHDPAEAEQIANALGQQNSEWISDQLLSDTTRIDKFLQFTQDFLNPKLFS